MAAAHRQHARQTHPRVAEAVRQPQTAGTCVGQLAPHRPRGGDHQLRPFVQPRARIVQRVDRRAGLEMQVGPPVDPLQQVPEERRDVVDVESRIVLPGHDQQILGQRKLPLAENGVGAGEQFLRLALLGIGDVALAADGQQQRMDAGRIDGVDRMDAGDDRRDDRPGQLVDDLRRTACPPAAAGRRR